MPVYYLLHDAPWFEHEACPVLATCWRQRSFEPCRSLCTALRPAVVAFAERYHADADAPLLCRAAHGLSFDRHFWNQLVGEVLLYGAAAIPEFEIIPDTLCCLLAREHYLERNVPRERFAPIQQAHYGTRDLILGSRTYRPEHAGYNNLDDVARLADYLTGIDPTHWTVADLEALAGMTDEAERVDELAFAREWFPALQELYQQARTNNQVIVCEIL